MGSPPVDRRVHRQLRILPTSVMHEPHRSLPQLPRILPRCRHDLLLSGNQTLHENRGVTLALPSRGAWQSQGMGTRYEPWASSEASRAVMQGNRRRDTKPEMTVRRLVHAEGLRYRVDRRPLPHLNRRADLVFTRAKVAVFVDGCYWHGCPEHGTTAMRNATYWGPKIARNRQRDAETTQLLTAAGWTVIRAWEHDDLVAVAANVVENVRRTQARLG